MKGSFVKTEIVRRQGYNTDGSADPIVCEAAEEDDPWPQSCWIMKRRTGTPPPVLRAVGQSNSHGLEPPISEPK